MPNIINSAINNQSALAARPKENESKASQEINLFSNVRNTPDQNQIFGMPQTIQINSEKELTGLLTELKNVKTKNNVKIAIKFDEGSENGFSYFGAESHSITIYFNNTKKLTLENIPKPFIENNRSIINELVGSLSGSLFQREPQALPLLKVSDPKAVVITGMPAREYQSSRRSTNFVRNKN